MRRRHRQELTGYAAAIDGVDGTIDAVQDRARVYEETGDAAVREEVRHRVRHALVPRYDAAEAAYAAATLWSLEDVDEDVAAGIASVRDAYHDVHRRYRETVDALEDLGIDVNRERERARAWYHHDDAVADVAFDVALDHPVFRAADLIEDAYRRIASTVPG